MIQAIAAAGALKDLKDKHKKTVADVNESLDHANQLLSLCLDTIHELELEKKQQIKSVELL